MRWCAEIEDADKFSWEWNLICHVADIKDVFYEVDTRYKRCFTDLFWQQNQPTKSSKELLFFLSYNILHHVISDSKDWWYEGLTV